MERIRVANTYTANRMGSIVAAWFVRDRINMALISELGQSTEFLHDVGRLVYPTKTRPNDTAVLIRGRWRSRRAKVSYHKVTDFIKRDDKPMLWRDRWIVRVQVGRKVYYSIHGNAAVNMENGQWLNNEGAKAWKNAMQWLYEAILDDQENNLIVRVGGDFNQFANDEVAWNPANMFNDLGLNWFNDRVMYLAWDPRNTKVVKREVTEKVPGADAHKSLTLHLRYKPKRRRTT